MPRKIVADERRFWARVPNKLMSRIEKHMPPHGWQSSVIRASIEKMADELDGAETPAQVRRVFVKAMGS